MKRFTPAPRAISTTTTEQRDDITSKGDSATTNSRSLPSTVAVKSTWQDYSSPCTQPSTSAQSHLPPPTPKQPKVYDLMYSSDEEQDEDEDEEQDDFGDDNVSNASNASDRLQEDEEDEVQHQDQEDPFDYMDDESAKDITTDTIVTSKAKPGVDYHDIYRVALPEEKAFRNNTRFVIECFSQPQENSSRNLPPLETPGVDKVLCIERGDIGCYLWHRTQNKLHYDKTEEEWPAFQVSAKRKEITIESFLPDGILKVFQDQGQQLLIINGADASGLVKGLCLEDIFHDVICGGDSGTEIAEPGDRFNRGVPIGITGCQSSEKKTSKVGVAMPQVIKGTNRYPNSFGRLTSCAVDLIEQAKESITASESRTELEKKEALDKLAGLFNNKDAGYNTHMLEWAGKCSEGATSTERNFLQSISWNCYVHDRKATDPRVKNTLQPHIDGQNPMEESHDVLIGVWQTIFSSRFGRYITLSGTGTLRKSCEYLLSRDILLKTMAEKLIVKASRYPSHIRWIEKKTFCPPDIEYMVAPIHCHTTVHLSAATFPVVHLRDWLWKEKQIVMSVYLAEEMCFAFLDTNNPYRYYSYVWTFISEYKLMGRIPLEEGETFLGNCQAFMLQNFGGWNGTIQHKDGVETERGAIRYQCCINVPRTNYVNLLGLRESQRIKKKYADQQVSRKVFDSAHKDIKDAVVGKGLLLASKLLYLDAILGMFLKPEWLDQCVMGSKKTIDRLKQKDDGFQTNNQVRMLYDSIRVIGDERGMIPRSTGEEIGCKTLKTEDSTHKDILFSDQGIHWPEIVQGKVIVKEMSHASGYVARNLDRGEFRHGCEAHYYPKWANQSLSLENIAGSHVNITSKANYVFKKGKPATTGPTKKRFRDRPALGPSIKFHQTQSLIQESHYLVIRDLTKFVANFLKIVPPRKLHDAIIVTQTSSGSTQGFLGRLNPDLLGNDQLFKKPFQQIREIDATRRPQYQVKRKEKPKWSYKTSFAARQAMLVHLMLNYELRGSQHWANKALEHRKDLLLILPAQSDKEVHHIAGILYREKTLVMFRYFKDGCRVGTPNKVSYDETVDSIEDMLT
jgi:hypothetical protein